MMTNLVAVVTIATSTTASATHGGTIATTAAVTEAASARITTTIQCSLLGLAAWLAADGLVVIALQK